MGVAGEALGAAVIMIVQGHTFEGKLFEVIAIDAAQSRDTDREVSKVHIVRRRRAALNDTAVSSLVRLSLSSRPTCCSLLSRREQHSLEINALLS